MGIFNETINNISYSVDYSTISFTIVHLSLYLETRQIR